MVGIADAVGRGTGALTPFSVEALLAAVAAACWWSALTVTVVGVFRSATVSQCIVAAFFLAGLASIRLVDSQTAWDLLSVSPYGPFTFVVKNVVAGRAGLETHTALVVIGSIVWPAAIGWLALRRRRHLLPRPVPAAAAGG